MQNEYRAIQSNWSLLVNNSLGVLDDKAVVCNRNSVEVIRRMNRITMFKLNSGLADLK